MELKSILARLMLNASVAFNRTAYGIEIQVKPAVSAVG